MKTSNKLLLGIFLSIILLTTTVQLVVYAKYKRGEYGQFKREQFSPMTSVSIPAVRFVSITGLGSCNIAPDDKPKLEIQKESVSTITYRIVNDTLFINGDTTKTINDLEQGSRNYNLVNIFLPSPIQITTAYSSLKLEAALNPAYAPSYTVQLTKNSYFGIRKHGRRDNMDFHFNQLHVYSDRSYIELDDHTLINDLNVQLTNSKINDKEAVIRSLTIDADSTSTVTLSGKNIKALK
jgi:hypothetical protein